MSNSETGFKSLNQLTTWISYVLYAQIIIAVFAIIFGFLEQQLLSDYQQGVYSSIEQAFADANTTIMVLQGIGIVSLIAFITSALLIMKWIYRANSNVRQLGAQSLSYTPAWAIGYFFIPIFNLWKPYQAMKQLWMASKNPLDWCAITVPVILPLWWGLWLVSNILNQSVFRLSASAQQLPELIQLNMLSQCSNLLDIPLALVTLAVINGIAKMHRSD